MKLAFSTMACPNWDLDTVLSRAKQYGYGGVELRGLQGQLNLPLCAELTADPAATRAKFAAAGVELVCLSSSAAFHMRNAREVADQKGQVRDFIDTASELGCPHVRVFGAEIPQVFLLGWERKDQVLRRISAALQELARYAESRRVTLLVENSGDFCGSEDLWFLVDSANSPAVRACWNTLAGRTAGERPTTSIPRLGRKIAMVHVSDGKFEANGSFAGHVLPGQGDCELERMFELLKGTGFDGWLSVDWPKLWNPSLADADKVLPEAQKYLTALAKKPVVVLSAYKGDKNAPKYRSRESAAV